MTMDEDIIQSELKQARKLMEEMQEIIEGSFDGILVTDHEGTALLVNDSYVRNTGLQREELIGHNMKELINPVWMKNCSAILAIEQRKPVSLNHITRHGKNIIVTGKPIFDASGNIKRVVVNTRDISEINELREELLKAKEMEKLYYERMNNEDLLLSGHGGIVATNAKMRALYASAKKISNFNTTVLILGESGVGKELLAKFIHDSGSLRKDKPFVAVNCGAIPENLLESELFGYLEGAFSGAAKGGKIGLFEAASGGTFFLDEIGELSLNLQVKLLRVLESRTVTRLGDCHPIPIDIRVLAATNKDLIELVEKGLFREDLYYRLNVISLEIPPLRERKDEIAPLALHFLNQFNNQYGQNKRLTIEVIQEFLDNGWKGNARQLRNVVENMVVMSNDDYLQLYDIPWINKQNQAEGGLGEGGQRQQNKGFTELVEEYEKILLLKAKEEYKSSRKMARALNIDQSTIVRKMKKYNINGEE